MKTQVCFVNTEDYPEKIVRLGVFRCSGDPNSPKDFTVYELCEMFYKHPDSDGMALVQLYDFQECIVQKGTENLVYSMITGCKDIRNITGLKHFVQKVVKE